MKKRKKILLVILILVGIIYLKNFYTASSLEKDNDKYSVIKLDKNENYKGIGQEKVNGKDGYFTKSIKYVFMGWTLV